MSKVQEACAFLGDGMARIDRLEEQVHGRQRRSDEMYFGVAVQVQQKNRFKMSGGCQVGRKHLKELDWNFVFLTFSRKAIACGLLRPL